MPNPLNMSTNMNNSTKSKMHNLKMMNTMMNTLANTLTNTKSQMHTLKLPNMMMNTMMNMIHHFKALKPLFTLLKMHYPTLCYPVQMANNH